MSCQNCWKKLLPFGLTLMLGFFAVYVNQDRNKDQKVEQKDVYVITSVNSKEIPVLDTKMPIGRVGEKTEDIKSDENSANANVFITSKPRASYTESARLKEISGTVALRVTFLANGEIGKIRLVEGLPNGLSEQAIAAAMKMKFEPARKKGIPHTVTRQVEYNFTLY